MTRQPLLPRGLAFHQWAAVVASFLGWTLDAFDFFLMVFMLRAIAAEFGTSIGDVGLGVTLTLAARPVGALIFGWLADRFGRRPVLMIDILLFSLLELASGFARDLGELLVLRTLFGVAMGGEWGIGASLAMESIPAQARGFVSGLLQEGYAMGYLVASLTFALLFDRIGWRGMFFVGVVPALLIIVIRLGVRESPAFVERPRVAAMAPVRALAANWKLTLYAITLMTAFNFFSHGTQDIYPTFLQERHHLDAHTVGLIGVVMNIGAIIGGIGFGIASQRIGRRRAIMLAALLALPIVPLWSLAPGMALLALGAFLIQVMVQGAWGVVPVHLNELSPRDVRTIFPGFAYQIGNLIASVNLPIQLALAHRIGYPAAMAGVATMAAVAIAIAAWLGPEFKDRAMTDAEQSGGHGVGGKMRNGTRP